MNRLNNAEIIESGKYTQRMTTDDRDPNWAHWLIGALAGIAFLLLQAFVGV